MRIRKTDTLEEGKPVACATFRIWNEEETFDEEFITDGEGMIEWDDTGEMSQSWTFELANMPKSIKSFALNVDSGTREGIASENFKISDSVEYSGLIPGLDYVLVGTIYNKETGEPSDINWTSIPEEVVAWVKVLGTSIDEPIAQANSRNPNRYLKRDALAQGAYGTPYIDSECSLSSPFVIIHGHNNSGYAFSDFAKYADRSYAESHNQIELFQRGKEPLNLKVIAVDIVNANNERLEIVQDEPLEGYVSKADIMLENPSEIKQLFAFSTCSYQTKNSRTVVYAALNE